MELEGVKDVQPADENYEYFFTVMCSSCREIHPKTVSFNQIEEHDISGSKGTAHFVWRCGNCKKEHSASFIPSDPTPKSKSKSTSPIPYSAPNAQYAPLIALDCRGLEFTEFHLSRGKWKCSAEESGTEFVIDWEELGREQGEEGRWDDYDESSGGPVGISELNSKIERA
ncbi:hypothetical protein IAR55_007011 [Kwoniella newhampshirensis]|uniref:DUF866-domain-containing protein n=1 Tax=Kwoniella newhampshirensis TaxID=1651941 RepID=A0AAW0YHI4_9TREE